MTRKVNKKKLVFGISDLITDHNAEPQKYVQVFDIHGNLLGEVEVYAIGFADEEE